jgi:GTP pyrophosphokinase
MEENYFELYDEALTKFGSNPADDLKYLINAINKYNLDVNIELISKAFELAYKLNYGKKRASGVPYYTHTLSVALIVIEELKVVDTAMLITALLHNVLRDYNVDLPYIRREFGQSVAVLLARFTRIVRYTRAKKTGADALRLLFLLLIKDARIFVLQICNRLHDMRTLKYLSQYKQVETAQETLNFYVPFTHKFGLTQIRRELESRSFYFYNPTQYKKNIDFLKVQKKLYSENIYSIVERIRLVLNQHNIKNNINIQHIPEYELFLQINSNKTNIDNIFSINVVIEPNDYNKCNDIFILLINELKPKSFLDINPNPVVEIDNSITLEMYSRCGKVRVNIKTRELEDNSKNKLMKQIEHNQIKLTDSQLSAADIILWNNWMQYVISNYSIDEAEKMIWLSLKNNLYNEKIIVNTTANEKNILPVGATSIDLAFNISEETGLSAITCKINGIIKSLFTELKNGDIVEIITSPYCKPDSSWLNYVVSFKSVAYLTDYFKNKYQINNNSKKNDITYFQKITIMWKKNDNILSDVQIIIGKDKINKMTFANNTNYFVVAIQTNINTTVCTNQMFLELIKVKGVKTIRMQPYH